MITIKKQVTLSQAELERLWAARERMRSELPVGSPPKTEDMVYVDEEQKVMNRISDEATKFLEAHGFRPSGATKRKIPGL